MLLLLVAVAGHATANPQQRNTHLVSLSASGGLSGVARQLGRGGYELSDGTPISFHRWYSSKWRNVDAVWMTQVTPGFGVFWGFGTGERGEKYEIEPSVKVGFLRIWDVSRNAVLSLSMTATLGGRFLENPCTANYGAIGGTQRVNCRLAASPLPPSETLKYLYRSPPQNQFAVRLRYKFEF